MGSDIWTMVIFFHLKSIMEMVSDKYSCAWKSTSIALKHLKDQIIEPTTHRNDSSADVNASCNLFDCNNVWYLPVINSMLRNFTDIAIKYYTFLKQFDNDSDIIVSAFGDIMQIVRIMTSDHTNRVNSNNVIAKTKGNKHTLCHGLFFTVNQIIKLCDTINNQTFLHHALSQINKFRSMWTSFPLSDVVTHLFYKGRFEYQKNNNLVQAKEELSFAFRLCHPLSLNQYRLLILLIPIQCALGYLPNMRKLPTAFVDRFDPIVKALKNGNIDLFKQAVDFYQDDFINCGIYLLVKKLDTLCFRSLLIKIYLVQQRMKMNKPHLIKLDVILKAIKIRKMMFRKSRYFKVFGGQMDEDEVDIDELECILSTLIFKKLIKGYIAHQTAIVS